MKKLTQLASPEGIVVDASSRNFYYVDAQQNRPEIGVARLDGTYRKTLAKEGLNQPRYLALDMKNRSEVFNVRNDVKHSNYTFFIKVIIFMLLVAKTFLNLASERFFD